MCYITTEMDNIIKINEEINLYKSLFNQNDQRNPPLRPEGGWFCDDLAKEHPR